MAGNDYPNWGTKEFYEAKAADVEKWAREYFALMYPDSDEELPQAQAEARVHTAYVRASWIVDKLADLDLMDSLIKMIAEKTPEVSGTCRWFDDCEREAASVRMHPGSGYPVTICATHVYLLDHPEEIVEAK